MGYESPIFSFILKTSKSIFVSGLQYFGFYVCLLSFWVYTAILPTKKSHHGIVWTDTFLLFLFLFNCDNFFDRLKSFFLCETLCLEGITREKRKNTRQDRKERLTSKATKVSSVASPIIELCSRTVTPPEKIEATGPDSLQIGKKRGKKERDKKETKERANSCFAPSDSLLPFVSSTRKDLYIF
jgi:hypothetical protein